MKKKHVFTILLSLWWGGSIFTHATNNQAMKSISSSVQEKNLSQTVTLNPQTMTHQMPELPYEWDALAPLMSKETLEFHYGKHLQGYVNNLNKLIAGTPFAEMTLEDIILKSDGGIFNNAAQTWNHTFFFQSLTPKAVAMPAALQEALTRSFGSPEAFKEEFTKAAAGLFGSGWVWLVSDANHKLSILPEANAGNPMTKGLKPLLVIDVWEHAYYIDYRNNRAGFIEAFWKMVDWNKVAARL